MKKRFNENQRDFLTSQLKSVIPSNLSWEVRYNKAGNLTVEVYGIGCWWTLYNMPVNNGKYVWRRLWQDFYGGYRSHLLHCKGRKTVYYGNWQSRTWNGVNAHAGIDSFVEAVDYFVKYLKKYYFYAQ